MELENTIIKLKKKITRWVKQQTTPRRRKDQGSWIQVTENYSVKREINSEESLSGLREVIKHYGNYLDGEKRENTRKPIQRNIIENFPNMGKMDIHFQEAQKHQTRLVEIHTDSQCNQIIKNQKLKTEFWKQQEKNMTYVQNKAP